MAESDGDTIPQPTATADAERPAQHSRCAYKTASECVMHKVKAATADDKLFIKYMNLCRVAHDENNSCVPGSIISNFASAISLLARHSHQAPTLYARNVSAEYTTNTVLQRQFTTDTME